MVTTAPSSPIVESAHLPDTGQERLGIGLGLNLVAEPKRTLSEAAKIMGVSVTTVRTLVAKGELPALRIGGKRLVLLRDIESFLSSRYGVQKPTPTVFHNRLNPLPQAVLESAHLRR